MVFFLFSFVILILYLISREEYHKTNVKSIVNSQLAEKDKIIEYLNNKLIEYGILLPLKYCILNYLFGIQENSRIKWHENKRYSLLLLSIIFIVINEFILFVVSSPQTYNIEIENLPVTITPLSSANDGSITTSSGNATPKVNGSNISIPNSTKYLMYYYFYYYNI